MGNNNSGMGVTYTSLSSSNVPIPHSSHIDGGVRDGQDLLIKGLVHPNCDRFSVNLCVGPSLDDSDCVLHFNPRLENGTVVRNHKQGGMWGMEETDGGCPFTRGQPFELTIRCDPHGYTAHVNHQMLCRFNHRVPKEMAQFLYIEGGITVNALVQRSGGPSFAQGEFYPHPPVYGPPVPYTAQIPGGLHPGKTIFLTGIPGDNPSRFNVTFQVGPYDSGNNTLIFDARFSYGNDFNQIIRTHQLDGDYGQEERDISFFPFRPSETFEMMVQVEQSGFNVSVNNNHVTFFNHRMRPYQMADYIHVGGDVQLTQVRFH